MEGSLRSDSRGQRGRATTPVQLPFTELPGNSELSDELQILMRFFILVISKAIFMEKREGEMM